MEKTALPQGDRVSCLWTSFRALMGPATKMVPGRRIYINIKKSESNFFMGHWVCWCENSQGGKKSVTTLVTCLCHGNLFPLYLVHWEVSSKGGSSERDRKVLFLSLSPLWRMHWLFPPKWHARCFICQPQKAVERRCFCQFSATEENQNSINQATLQQPFKPSSTLLLQYYLPTVVVHTVHIYTLCNSLDFSS